MRATRVCHLAVGCRALAERDLREQIVVAFLNLKLVPTRRISSVV